MPTLSKAFGLAGPCKQSGKLTTPLLVLLAIFLFGRPAEAQYGGGTGEPNDPYLIYTAEQMNAIGANPGDLDKHFKLMADIDLSAYTGTSFNMIGIYVGYKNPGNNAFTGVFDGNGKKIYNFTYTSTDTDNIGLFAYVGSWSDKGEIRDLGLIAPDVDAGTGAYVGSLVGRLEEGTITNCYAEGGSVSGNEDVGGLVGINGEWGRWLDSYPGTISNCYSSAVVRGYERVAGLVGHNYVGTITNSYSTGSVTGTTDVGGLVGQNGSRITNCYSVASVSGTTDVGGLVGENSATITYSYSVGSVTGTTNVGGLVGSNVGNVYGSFWDIETGGQSTSAGGTGKTTAQMQMASTFIGWAGCGNEGIWTIDEGNDYPRLWWENKPGEALYIQQLSDFVIGSGTEDDPYLIYTAEELNTIGLFPCDWDKNFKLMADIDLSGFIGTDFNIIGIDWQNPFSGVFDGNGHIISNFSYTSTDRDYVGLFEYVSGKDAQIKDLGLIDPNVDAGTGVNVGSLVGSVGYRSVITNCFAEGGSVSGNEDVGGLVGDNDGTITNCYSSGDVSGNGNVGGLVGRNHGTITNSYSTGTVSGNDKVGGLVGSGGTITNCSSSGSVTGNKYVGGLVGSGGTITNCYSAGSVSGNQYVGGLVGSGSAVRHSFWDIETSGQVTSDGGMGKTTAEMRMASTFIAWWCDPVWTIDEGKDYPRLWWENKPGEALDIQQLSDFLTGSGTELDPYLIYTAEQLNTIGLIPCEWDKHFKLMADIDLSTFTGTAFNIIGTGWRNPFTGVFDGNGHTISNFSCTSTDRNYVGLFGYVSGKDAQIKDLGLIDPHVDAGTGRLVASLVGGNSGTVTNCYTQGGSVTGANSVGGLVGSNSGRIINCNSSASVSSSGTQWWQSSVGGLVGRNYKGTITNCYATGTVSGKYNVGGLVGDNDNGTITNCYVTGSVSGERTVGGLVGRNHGTITNCYSSASPLGRTNVGGLVGYSDGTITNCYATGIVSGNQYVGGLVGHNYYYKGEATNSFWDIQTSGQASSDGGMGKTTAEMQTESTFTSTGWDFVAETQNGIEDIWWILEGQDYPRLWWELVEE